MRRNLRPRIERRTTAAVLALTLGLTSAMAIGAIASAVPVTKHDVSSAQSQLDSLNRQLDQLVEQYDQQRIALEKTEKSLSAQQQLVATAQSEAAQARALLSARAVAAYEGDGAASNLEVLLGATSLTDFSDRVEYLDHVVQSDADIAAAAQAAQVRAQEASARLAVIAKQRSADLSALADQKAQIESGIAQQQSLLNQLKDRLAKQEAAARAAAKLAEQQAAQQAAQQNDSGSGGSGGSGGGGSGSGGGGSGGGGGNPPADPRAPTAVHAAFSQIGVPYQWGGASPQTGFDCSGLTMWSWAQAGVSLPHSSALQYTVIPHVDRANLMPGDLLFFYTPISHVAIYVGGGMEIHAPHTGSYVQEVAVPWADYVGAGRP